MQTCVGIGIEGCLHNQGLLRFSKQEEHATQDAILHQVVIS